MVAIGADHGGFLLKEEVKKYLDENKIKYKDFGVFNGEKSDYPIVAKKVANVVADNNSEFKFGLLFCGTGLGMALAANKVNGIRAVCLTDSYSAKFSRLHNNANILCLGGRVVGVGLAEELISVFLTTPFEGGRHEKRLNMI